MNRNPAILKSLIAYAVCVPLAIWIGYLLTLPMDRTNWSIAGILALLLITPVLLRWHHFLLVASWNVTMVIFFLPGGPGLWLPMVAISLGISVLYRALNSKAHFIPAPQITLPLLCLGAVVIFTAEMTGGIGLHSLGSEVMGGKRYIFIIMAILGYFALTAQRIPPERAGWYMLFFLLGGFLAVIGDTARIMPSFLDFIFLLFPPTGYIYGTEARYGGVATVGVYGTWLMLALYGVRGIFLSGSLWRLPVFALLGVLQFLGGFRSLIIQCALVFFIQFFLERMQRTKLLPIFVFAGIFMAVLVIPFAGKLPYTFQRSLAFLPLNIDPFAKQDAEASTDWRVRMWKAVLPEVPGHLLLGKGYAITQSDYDNMVGNFGYISADNSGSAIAGDYHNGPLSVILPFGIWGVIAFLWFLIASGRALQANYRYGDPSLRIVNTFLFAYFITEVIMFFFVFGLLYTDMAIFVGIVGLSISLNGGIRRRSDIPVETRDEAGIPATAHPRLLPFYQP